MGMPSTPAPKNPEVMREIIALPLGANGVEVMGRQL